jgi:arylsulfatase A-like enzyme
MTSEFFYASTRATMSASISSTISAIHFCFAMDRSSLLSFVMNSASTSRRPHSPHILHSLFNVTILSAYFHAFMEWLFFVTKPSSLSSLSAFESLKVLVVTGGTIALILITGLVVLSLPALLMRKPKLLVIGYIVPTFILAVAALILLDNFTYTIFRFGVISTAGAGRVMYALGFAAICWRIFRFVQRTVRTRNRSASLLAISLLTVSIAGILTMISNDRYSNNTNTASPDSASASFPNIIILGSDGLSAQFLSAYGFPLKTTPFLSELAETSLVAENAFPNATSTTASTTSMLTGKEAVAVRVFRYPDILTGDDSFEHLPGILKRNGYRTVEIGTPHYVDARRLNLLDGFEIVYDQSWDLPLLDPIRTVLGNSPSTFFIQTMTERASERLFHIFLIQGMQNPISEVNNPEFRTSDEKRVEQILDIVDRADRPVFIFAHLMDTHGPNFSHQKQVFSSGPDTKDWDMNHYLDSILSFDGHVKKIYDHLAQTGQLDNTILVIYTDHGYQYTINQRIPILIHFPEDKYAGKLRNNVQVIDIPTTLLDYLDISSPKWMDGTSLLNGEPPIDRKIFSTAASSPPKIGPPFYQLRVVQVIVCHKWFTLNVKENTFKAGVISRRTTHCDENLLPSKWQVHQTILEYLEKNRYDTRSLR